MTVKRTTARGQVDLLQPTPNTSAKQKARNRKSAKRARQARKRNRDRQ